MFIILVVLDKKQTILKGKLIYYQWRSQVRADRVQVF